MYVSSRAGERSTFFIFSQKFTLKWFGLKSSAPAGTMKSPFIKWLHCNRSTWQPLECEHRSLCTPRQVAYTHAWRRCSERLPGSYPQPRSVWMGLWHRPLTSRAVIVLPLIDSWPATVKIVPWSVELLLDNHDIIIKGPEMIFAPSPIQGLRHWIFECLLAVNYT